MKISQLNFEQPYVGLPESFWSRPAVAPFPDPYLVDSSLASAELLGLNSKDQPDAEFLNVMTGQAAFPGMDPVATVYAGHQFGQFVSQLGDGRAQLLGRTNYQGQHWELQLKGTGPTRYSRDGDGRAVLRSTIREYLCSEAMVGLGIPTTRALAIIGSDIEVYRERIESAAILVRMAPSHLRFGHFEFFTHQGRFDDLKLLADFCIEHEFPQYKNDADSYLKMFEDVLERTASLAAQWQSVGFQHGVMNSDNMSILGLTIDYGPFGFMEGFDPNSICNHSDHHGC